MYHLGDLSIHGIFSGTQFHFPCERSFFSIGKVWKRVTNFTLPSEIFKCFVQRFYCTNFLLAVQNHIITKFGFVIISYNLVQGRATFFGLRAKIG